MVVCSSLLELILGRFWKILLKKSVSNLASFIASSVENQTLDHLIFLRKIFTDISLLFNFFPGLSKKQNVSEILR